jgi:adenylate kinase
VTGEPLIQRPDDREDVVLARLKQYERESRPVIDFYEYISKQINDLSISNSNYSFLK